MLFQMLIICLWTGAAWCAGMDVPRLTLDHAYSVEGPENFQPSGLTMVEGRLYTISDKHDRAIYRLKLEADTAVALSEIPIPPFSGFFENLDFEGITQDADGHFYLVSESRCDILEVSMDGTTATWIAPGLKNSGAAAGLFQLKNAGREGICRTSDNQFLVCAERDPRGFAEIDRSGNPPLIHAWKFEESRFDFPKNVSLDFSDLYFYQNAVYVLERNAFIVCRLVPDSSGRFLEGPGWSYHHVETAAVFRYEDMQYGKAEGLCIDDRFIYILIDNNNDARAGNPVDRRPLLLVFRHPDDFGP